MSKAILGFFFLFINACTLYTLKPVDQSISSEYQYSSHGLTGDLYTPQGPGPFPAVLLIHGGSWSSGSRVHMSGIARNLVQNNFIVFNISYRLAPKDLFPAQLDDCRDAVRWMRKNAVPLRIDPKKIGVFGYSAGGQLAGLLATDQKDQDSRVQAAVTGSAPHDLTHSPKSPAVIRLLGVSFAEHPEVYKQASPLFHVSPDDPPMFIYHGRQDTIVSPYHSQDMKFALDKSGVESELYWIDGYGHIDLFLFARSPLRKAIEFMKQHL